jgi:hypothetical protein
VAEFFEFDNLIPELVLGLGLALLVGNGLAWWRHRQGKTPDGVENPQFRPGRVLFLVAVGVVLTVWGAVTVFV